MFKSATSIERLANRFARMPGIGRKSASRLAFYLLRGKSELALRLADALHKLVENTRFCSSCYNVTEQDPCPICANPARDHGLICVVEEPMDLLSLERTEQYHGVYHVLHGSLSPLEGIFAEDLRVKELEARLRAGDVHEVLLATNPTSEGVFTCAMSSLNS